MFVKKEEKMKVEYDYKKNEFNITLQESELIEGFKTRKDLQSLLHNIVKNTYGEEMANKCFPLGGNKDD